MVINVHDCYSDIKVLCYTDWWSIFMTVVLYEVLCYADCDKSSWLSFCYASFKLYRLMIKVLDCSCVIKVLCYTDFQSMFMNLLCYKKKNVIEISYQCLWLQLCCKKFYVFEIGNNQCSWLLFAIKFVCLQIGDQFHDSYSVINVLSYEDWLVINVHNCCFIMKDLC